MKAEIARKIVSQIDSNIVIESDINLRQLSKMLSNWKQNQQNKLLRVSIMIEECKLLTEKEFKEKYDDFSSLYFDTDERKFTP